MHLVINVSYWRYLSVSFLVTKFQKLLFFKGVADKRMDNSFSTFSCFKHGATPTTRYGYLLFSNLAKSTMWYAQLIQNRIQIMAFGDILMQWSSLLITEKKLWRPERRNFTRHNKLEWIFSSLFAFLRLQRLCAAHDCKHWDYT